MDEEEFYVPFESVGETNDELAALTLRDAFLAGALWLWAQTSDEWNGSWKDRESEVEGKALNMTDEAIERLAREARPNESLGAW